MSRPQTYEQRLLFDAEQYLNTIAKTPENRLQFLESVASLKGGSNVEEYRRLMGYCAAPICTDNVEHLLHLIDNTDIPFAMAISSLAREQLTIEEQKKNGAFYTDFRLATLLTDNCAAFLKADSVVADFAAGTGVLLVGIAKRYKDMYPDLFNDWISNCLYAFDMAPLALRGATAAMLSMSNDLKAIQKMASNWRICDSLMDSSIKNIKIDIVVGNPPWGKIKLSRHSFLTQNGEHRIYGTDYQDFDNEDYKKQKKVLQEYSKRVKEKYGLLSKAEPDMYMAFMQMAIEAVNKNGYVLLFVPAGLIRSQGTQVLREYLLEKGQYVEFNLLDNQGNYFSIDSRFKFVLLSFGKAKKSTIPLKSFIFSICQIYNTQIVKGEKIEFDINQLAAIRPDLTIPEVRTTSEKNLFFKVCENGLPWGVTEDIWKADVSREVDMTNDREKFVTRQQEGCIPVIEGRMVQQHRFGAKAYVSGSGRSAKWHPCSSGCTPQFYCEVKFLQKQQYRIHQQRAGYCDIAGQTNERAMMSSLIPANVVCGNKVPTVIFPNDYDGNMLYLWIGITNSFVFDWMIRRIISTTVNYFLLFSIPMPDIEINSVLAIEIIERTKRLSDMQEDYYVGHEMPELRAEIDALVARAYDLTMEDMELVMQDFPIIDRKQPCLPDETRATVTRDLLLSKYECYFGVGEGYYTNRSKQEKSIGAKAYIPTEMMQLVDAGRD